MNEFPILFKGPLVRAILGGQKTVTRRLVKVQPADGWAFDGEYGRVTSSHRHKGKFGAFIRRGVSTDFPELDIVPCPYGMPGDRLWVRETWRGVVAISPPGATPEYGVARYVPDQEHCRRVEYSATQERGEEPWRPSIHMPRWACRLLLEVTAVRVERLQDITPEQCLAEGIEQRFPAVNDRFTPDILRGAFAELWNSTGGDFQSNPWVWVIDFKRVEPARGV